MKWNTFYNRQTLVVVINFIIFLLILHLILLIRLLIIIITTISATWWRHSMVWRVRVIAARPTASNSCQSNCFITWKALVVMRIKGMHWIVQCIYMFSKLQLIYRERTPISRWFEWARLEGMGKANTRSSSYTTPQKYNWFQMWLSLLKECIFHIKSLQTVDIIKINFKFIL